MESAGNMRRFAFLFLLTYLLSIASGHPAHTPTPTVHQDWTTSDDWGPVCETGPSDTWIDPLIAMRLSGLFCDWVLANPIKDETGNENVQFLPADLTPTANGYTAEDLQALTAEGYLIDFWYFTNAPNQPNITCSIVESCAAVLNQTIDYCELDSHYVGGWGSALYNCGMYSYDTVNCTDPAQTATEVCVRWVTWSAGTPNNTEPVSQKKHNLEARILDLSDHVVENK